MLPVYEPGPFLHETLASLLAQAPAPEDMQIEVVDDGSASHDWEEVVRRLGAGRVEIHRLGTNHGLAGAWNACIARSRGRWVHILHQDDVVLPGFYERLRAGVEAEPRAGAAFCRHASVDEAGSRLHVSELERDTPGLVDGWLERIAVWQRVQCAAMVVRRDTYERLGGFRPELCYALDWDMWRRIAAAVPVWFEPTLLACYREHARSESARLARDARDLADLGRSIELAAAYLPPERARALTAEARRSYARYGLGFLVRRALAAGDQRRARRLVAAALRLDHSWRAARPLAGAVWAIARSRWASGTRRRPASARESER
jgi:glycosyltransferase involved in cell wall biosynthesis